MKRWMALVLLAGCSDGSSSPAPSADFTAPDSGNVGDVLLFDAAASKEAAHFQWDFGDGSHGGTGKLAHLYSAAGDYTVTLTVAASGGKTATATHDITI